MISQVVSSQLQLHNMRGSHKIKEEDEYEEDFEGEDNKSRSEGEFMNKTSNTVLEEEAKGRAEQ
jgi:hypothetical protein